MLRIYPYTN